MNALTPAVIVSPALIKSCTGPDLTYAGHGRSSSWTKTNIVTVCRLVHWDRQTNCCLAVLARPSSWRTRHFLLERQRSGMTCLLTVVLQHVSIILNAILNANSLLSEEASPSIGNTLLRVLTMFTCSAITLPEVNAFGWNFGNSEHVVWSWPRQILGAICAEARAGDLAEVLFFCQVNNARLCRFPVSQISRNLHTILWRGESFRNNFLENLPLSGLFFQKTVIIVNNFRFQAAISRKWLQILENRDRLARLWNVGFPSVLLESTQSHSLGQQSPYTEWLSSTHLCRTAMQLAHAALMWHYIITNSFAGRQHHLNVALLFSFE